MSARAVRSAAAGAALLALAACSGGGTSPAPPARVRAAQPASVTISVAVPKRANAARRRPAYVAPTTASMSVVVTPFGGPAAPPAIVACAATCSASLAVAPGTATFAITLYDGNLGRGSALSTGTLTATVVANTTNAFSVTFDPIVADFRVGLPSAGPFVPPLVIGRPATVANVFFPYDADGNVIVGPGSYVDASGAPLTFAFTNNGAGHTQLGVTSQSAPGPVSLTYDGHGVRGSISASNGSHFTTASYVSSLPPEQQNATNTLYPYQLALGSDGNVWFTQSGTPALMRHNADGTISSFSTPISGIIGAGLTLAGDGNLWFPYTGHYVRVTPAGQATDFTLPPALSSYEADSAAPDASGAIVFTTFGKLGRLALDGTATVLYTSTGFGPRGAFAGPDQRVWFADTDASGTYSLGAYGNGVVSHYAVTTPLGAVFSGPDGTIWAISGSKLIRYDTSGTLLSTTPLTTAFGAFTGSIARSVARDAAGHVYFADPQGNAIGRLDASGAVLEYPTYWFASDPSSVVLTGDGRLYWNAFGTFGGNGNQGGGLGSVDPTLF